MLEAYFGGSFGRIAPGCKADLVVLDYHAPTPLVDANAATHLVWGVSSQAVQTVMVDGNLVMENRTFGFDVAEIYAKAAEVAARVWKRVDGIRP